jgi:hypothetical protein
MPADADPGRHLLHDAQHSPRRLQPIIKRSLKDPTETHSQVQFHQK